MNEIKTIILAIVALIVGGFFLLQSDQSSNQLRFVTEEYPPLTHANEAGEITGAVGDLFKEIKSRHNDSSPIELLPWSEAYKAAHREPNVVIFSMERTAERESLFSWVGPVSK